MSIAQEVLKRPAPKKTKKINRRSGVARKVSMYVVARTLTIGTGARRAIDMMTPTTMLMMIATTAI
jgi:hypothetical protein